MGRLTLNVLLSFAQFEREVTAERIRDKIATSKKKGLWMGGVPPLGYDPNPDPKIRGLLVNPAEAETVKTIYKLYDELGCLNAVKRRVDEVGLRSKLHQFKSGRIQGGNSLSRGQIYALLRNPIYIGKIRHKEDIWPGQHEAILDVLQWERVQTKLQEASVRPRGRNGGDDHTRSRRPAPLTGKFRDETGDRLTPTHTKRHGKRIRYYVSNRLISAGTDPQGWRLRAFAFETAVSKVIANHLTGLAQDHRFRKDPDLILSKSVVSRVESLATQLTQDRLRMLEQVVESGCVEKGHITLRLHTQALAEQLGMHPNEINPQVFQIEAKFDLRRRGVEGKISIGDIVPSPDPTLLRALWLAHKWTRDLRNGTRLYEIASTMGVSAAFIRRRAQLAFLSPLIQGAILDGRQPVGMTLEKIIRKPIPLDWDEQARMYGFNTADNNA